MELRRAKTIKKYTDDDEWDDVKHDANDSDEGSLLFDMWDSSGSENEENSLIKNKDETKEGSKITSIDAQIEEKHKLDLSDFNEKYIKTYCSTCKVTRTKKMRKPRCLECDTQFIYCCGKCQRPYKYYSDLLVHVRTKHLEPLKETVSDHTFTCRQCDKTFRTLKYKNLHEKVCGVEPRISCDFCPYKCRFQSGIVKHIKNNHLDKLNVRCSKCGERFTNLQTLFRHTKFYCKKRPWLKAII